MHSLPASLVPQGADMPPEITCGHSHSMPPPTLPVFSHTVKRISSAPSSSRGRFTEVRSRFSRGERGKGTRIEQRSSCCTSTAKRPRTPDPRKGNVSAGTSSTKPAARTRLASWQQPSDFANMAILICGPIAQAGKEGADKKAGASLPTLLPSILEERRQRVNPLAEEKNLPTPISSLQRELSPAIRVY